MKHIVLISVAAMFFVASPSFAQQKGASSSEMKTKEVGVDGLTLHYIELGQGTPVVLVHGTLEDYRTWDGQLEAFSKGYRLISYSRRYHYPNEWPKVATDFSVTLHAKDLAAFIKALNLPPVHLVGHSYGAFIAFLVARDHPEVIRSLTLGEPPVWPLLKTTPEGDALLSAIITRSIATSEAFKQGNDEEGVRRFVNGVLGDGSYEKIPPPVLKRVMDNVQELKGEASSRDLFPPTTCEDVQKVKAPTLLVDGGLSPKVFRLVDDMLEHCLPSVERATIPAASHQMEVENPQAFNDTVLAFIAKH
ncbi:MULTISPECIES: alpha/beta fold hydrolase [Bradyrhizobium]|uniref:alpha/beta fold hydrolase n=1 Tax=Bradyrhizobium TaxID=374 RepID=UPI00131B1A2F|nr:MULTISPECIES: alpha/beta hydrolase [Bradyrhizobium]UFW45941.1 alpha/beta hydrolase [Bradyrhizobium arachidis]